MVAAMVIDYQDFIFTAWHNSVWVTLAYDDRGLAPLARNFFWEQYETMILAEIQTLTAHGWQPIGAVDASAIRLQRTDHYKNGLELVDVFLGVLTLGASVLIEMLIDSPRHYIEYRPVEFRVRLRRPQLDQESCGRSYSHNTARTLLNFASLPALPESGSDTLLHRQNV
jgi:hypothetical protein